VVGGAAAAAALRASPAQGACGSHRSTAVGFHFGLAFGGPGWPVKLNYGITGRFGQDFAGYARLEGFGLGTLQWSAGGTSVFGGDGGFAEVGIAGAIGHGAAGAGPHLGIGPGGRGGGLLLGGSYALIGDSTLSYVQLAPLLFPSEICFPSGRALRVGGGIVLPPVAAMQDGACADDLLASAWLDDARAELASVPAFLRLARELDAVGAPRELRRAALAAADDERFHAAAAFGMASRWRCSALLAAPLSAPPRFDRASLSALTRLAVEAWEDGCLGEGTAALCARRALRCVRDEQAARTLELVAPDEERHAQLSWQVLEWCWKAGGPRVRDAVVALSQASVAASPTADEDADWLRWNGRLTTAERSCARAEVEERAKARLSAAVAQV